MAPTWPFYAAIHGDVVILEGYWILKEASVNFMMAEIGWDGKVWEEPMELKLVRFSAGGAGEGAGTRGSREMNMMPFGVGRICPGLRASSCCISSTLRPIW